MIFKFGFVYVYLFNAKCDKKENFAVFVFFSLQKRFSNITKSFKSMQGHFQDTNNLHNNQLNCYKQIKSTNKQRSSLINKNIIWGLKLLNFTYSETLNGKYAPNI